jgi:hypothetical protein
MVVRWGYERLFRKSSRKFGTDVQQKGSTAQVIPRDSVRLLGWGPTCFLSIYFLKDAGFEAQNKLNPNPTWIESKYPIIFWTLFCYTFKHIPKKQFVDS